MPAPAVERTRSELSPGFPIRVGVGDLGSNAVRLMVAEFVGPARYTELHAERVPVRLGRSAFTTGSIDDEAFEAVVRALEGFAGTLDEYGVEHARIVATSATRESANGPDLVRAVRERAGLDVELINGAEEARLIYWAAREKVSLGDGPWVLADLGGGSLEIALVDGVGLLASESFTIGTVRLLGELATSSSTGRLRRLIEEYVGGLRLQALEGRPRPRGLMATGGNIEDLAVLIEGSPSGGVSVVEIRDLEDMTDRLAGLTVEERIEDLDLRPDRADVILPAAMVYARIARILGMTRIHVPHVGVKEGVLHDLVQRLTARAGHDARRAGDTMAGAVAFGRRFLFDESHAVQVARLAERLFDQLEDVHDLDARDRRLLVAAAILHDVGQSISYRGHHKHSYYLISQAELPGLAPEEVEIVANVARYHRKAHPSEKHEPFAALDDDDRERVTKLAAILRLADALDREHVQNVHSLWVSRARDTVRLELVGAGDFALERWAVAKKRDLFETTFGLGVEVEDEEEDA